MRRPVHVVIPYVDRGVPERQQALKFVVGRLAELLPDADVGLFKADPFSRAAAINNGVREAPHDAIIVQSDPDSLVPAPQLHEAIDLAGQEDGLVLPFSRHLYLNAERSAWAVGWGIDSAFAELGPPDCEFSGEGGVGNVTVFSRATWEAAGGLDERFGTWGGEDAAFSYACHWLIGPFRRLAGPMYHLWHPRLPESEPGHPEYLRQMTIVSEYRDASSPDDIFRILASR